MNNAFGFINDIFVFVFYILIYLEQSLQKIDGPEAKAIVLLGSLLAPLALLILFIQHKRLRALRKQLGAEEKWHRIAYEDALTGLQNRRAYDERIHELEDEMDRNLSVHTVMIDIDHFKHINDTMGHSYGDTMLRRTARYIQSVFHMESCAVFRIGGDEFAVIATNMADGEINALIENLSRHSADKLGITLSAGCSRVNFENSRAVEVSFEMADRRMYAYKVEHTI